MNYFLSVTLLMLSLINAGILAISFPNILRETDLKGRWYFGLSLLSGSLGLLGMSGVVLPVFQGAHPVWFSTPANLMILLTFVSMWLFTESLTRNISRQIHWLICVSVLLWAVGFEYLRQNGSIYQRSLYLYTPQLMVLLPQIKALKRALKLAPSQQLRALEIITWIEGPLIGMRILALHLSVLPQNYALSDLSAFILLLLALHFGLQVVSFSVASGYWLEIATKRRNTAEREVQRIKELLDEKNTLIRELTRVHKVAETGALSASLAHEINQPLSAVQLDTQMLQELLKDKSSTDVTQPYLQRILANNARVAQTIQTLRKLFNASEQPRTLTQVDRVIREALELALPQTRHKQIQLVQDLAAPVPTTLVPQDLQIVLINLINNACQALHHTPNACIQVKSWQSDHHTYIKVSDNGPGIPLAEQPHIFKLLKSFKPQGMGIGLWLSQNLIAQLGGQLTLESFPDTGANFLIALPRH